MTPIARLRDDCLLDLGNEPLSVCRVCGLVWSSYVSTPYWPPPLCSCGGMLDRATLTELCETQEALDAKESK